jgi:uroporphyrinogen decarboxylase
MTGGGRRLSTDDTLLLRALRGQPTQQVPFWEVWFAMSGLAEHLLGHPLDGIADEVAFARRMGWEYVRIPVPSRRIGATSAIASDGTSHYVQGGRVDLQELRSKPEPDWSIALTEAHRRVAVARAEGMVTIAYVPWAFHAVTTALGLEVLSLLLYDDPPYIAALFDWVEEGVRAAIREVIIPAGIDVVLVDGDCAFKNGLMVNPRMFRELVFDRTRQTVAALREADTIYTFHSDGKADELLPLLIELGFSAFHGVEAAANDLGDIKLRFGRDITLMGNMDVVLLTHATVAEVRACTEKMLTIGMEGGRYVAACNTSPLDYIPYQNYLAMVDVIHNF